MTIGWEVASRLTGPLAARVDSGPLYYVGLAVMVVILIWTLIVAYRHWEEMNDVEEPDSPADLLESFRQAHAEGELDDQELDRVRRLLSTGDGSADDLSARTASRGPESPTNGSTSPG